jgi:predicted nucleic acid-binding protein
MLVADTSVWIEYLKGTSSAEANLLDREIEHTRILVPDLVLAEILRGMPNERAANDIQITLLQFQIVEIGGQNIAIKAATSYRKLRSLGITIRGLVDLLIATWCIENQIPLLHADRDFIPMEQHLGLRSLRS